MRLARAFFNFQLGSAGWLCLCPAIGVPGAARASCASLYGRIKDLALRPALLQPIGETASVTVTQEGQAHVTEFVSNRVNPFPDHPDFELEVPFKNLEPGYFFQGPDGRAWKFENKTNRGLVTFSSGGRTLSWQSGYLPAHTYELNSPILSHPISIVIPALQEGAPDLKSLEGVRATLVRLPPQALEPLHSLQIHAFPSKWDAYWGTKYVRPGVSATDYQNPFRASASASRGTVKLFPAGDMDDLDAVLYRFRHELGHVIADAKYGSTVPDEAWAVAMKSDGHAVSAYASNSLDEDFAETVALYLAEDAGLKNYAEAAALLRNDARAEKPIYDRYRARFAILDAYFKLHTAERIEDLERLRKVTDRLVVGAGVAGALVIGDVVLFHVFPQKAPETPRAPPKIDVADD